MVFDLLRHQSLSPMLMGCFEFDYQAFSHSNEMKELKSYSLELSPRPLIEDEYLFAKPTCQLPSLLLVVLSREDLGSVSSTPRSFRVLVQK